MTAATMRKQIALYAAQFPSPGCCTAEGILCAGGDLLPARLLAAYSRGIFPWYGEDMPLLWWCPDPRCVLPPDAFHLPRRSARALRNHPFELRMDTAFSRVIRACAAPRRDSEGTWILPEMIAAYERLHALGYAHSVEAWRDGELLGGLYGVALGGPFSGNPCSTSVPKLRGRPLRAWWRSCANGISSCWIVSRPRPTCWPWARGRSPARNSWRACGRLCPSLILNLSPSCRGGRGGCLFAMMLPWAGFPTSDDEPVSFQAP